MYKVFPVEGGYQIFWCPSEHERQPLNRVKVYTHANAAYRRCKQLNQKANKEATVK